MCKLKVIILPRQTRDKHRESDSTKECPCFLAVCARPGRDSVPSGRRCEIASLLRHHYYYTEKRSFYQDRLRTIQGKSFEDGRFAQVAHSACPSVSDFLHPSRHAWSLLHCCCDYCITLLHCHNCFIAVRRCSQTRRLRPHGEKVLIISYNITKFESFLTTITCTCSDG